MTADHNPTADASTPLRAIYEARGPAPAELIAAVPFARAALQAGQARVALLAAPINPSDLLTLTGEYGMLPPLPAIGGNEGVGKVIELGPDTAGPALGQTVLLPMGIGTWASEIVAEAAKLVPLPNAADPAQLSMLSVNPPTAALLLRDFVTLAAGEYLIQNVANSGVGTYLVQLAAKAGIKTVNIVRREGAIAAVKEAGGELVLLDGPGLAKRVREATGGAAIRLGIDAVGGAATDRLASCLAEGGTLVNYGLMSGEPCQVSAKSFVFNDLTLKGFWLARWFGRASRAEQAKLYGELAGLIADGSLRTRIAHSYRLADIKQAVAAAGAGERDGKILLTA